METCHTQIVYWTPHLLLPTVFLSDQFQVTPLGSNFLNLEIPWITLSISPSCRSCHILSFDLRTISGFRITFSVSLAMVITHDIMPNFNLCNYLLTHVHAFTLGILSASLVAQMVQNLPAVQEIRVQSLGWDDTLEKGMATHSTSCLEKSMDRGAWWATANGITKSQTWLND